MKYCHLLIRLTALLTLATCLVAAPADSDAATYKFGITPWQKGQTQDDINHLYRPMLDEVSQKTGDTFLIVSARDYKQMIGFLANGDVDFCSISPAPYVLARGRNPNIRLVATELTWDKARHELTDSYLGYFVALKTREDIRTITDIAQLRFGFVRHESSSGFKYPNSLLRDRGIDYKTYFSHYYFLGSHPRVTDAIAAGSIDAGATWDFNLKQAQTKHGDIFRIIFTTPPIPNLCIAAHSTIPKAKVAEIQRALVEIDPALLKGLPAAGYVVRPDSFYDVVRHIALEP